MRNEHSFRLDCAYALNKLCPIIRFLAEKITEYSLVLQKKLNDIPQLLPGSSPLSIHDPSIHTDSWNQILKKVRDNIEV